MNKHCSSTNIQHTAMHKKHMHNKSTIKKKNPHLSALLSFCLSKSHSCDPPSLYFHPPHKAPGIY